IACPLFVPLVENGYINRDNQVTRMVAEDYLKPIIGTDLDTLILGCTHFPIIKEIIGDILGKDVKLIDSGYETARTAAAMLSRENMLLNSEQLGNRSFYVSDSIETFTENATIFLNEEITGSVEHHVW
ncbi:MAG: glutamate racemase, partial [Massilioclostridium sp.]